MCQCFQKHSPLLCSPPLSPPKFPSSLTPSSPVYFNDSRLCTSCSHPVMDGLCREINMKNEFVQIYICLVRVNHYSWRIPVTAKTEPTYHMLPVWLIKHSLEQIHGVINCTEILCTSIIYIRGIEIL